jgi:hypothetical protein
MAKLLFMVVFFLLGMVLAAVTGCQTPRGGTQAMKVEVDIAYHHEDGEVRLRLRQ